MANRTKYYLAVDPTTYEILKISKQQKIVNDYADRRYANQGTGCHVYMFNSNFYPEILTVKCGDILTESIRVI
jgi:hypothetical protein